MTRAVLCIKNGDPTLPLGHGVLELSHDQTVLPPKPGYLKVQVCASSVNYAGELR